MWQDRAEFSVRAGSLEAALVSVRAALEIAPAHLPALLLLSAASLTLHLRQAVSDEAPAHTLNLETARVAAHALVEAQGPDVSLPWAMLALVYSNGGVISLRTRFNTPADITLSTLPLMHLLPDQ